MIEKLKNEYGENNILLNNFLKELSNDSDNDYKNVIDDKVKFHGNISIFCENFGIAIKIMNILLEEFNMDSLRINEMEIIDNSYSFNIIDNPNIWENMHRLIAIFKSDLSYITKKECIDILKKCIVSMKEFEVYKLDK